jgi:hypothetical protein
MVVSPVAFGLNQTALLRLRRQENIERLQEPLAFQLQNYGVLNIINNHYVKTHMQIA